MSAENEIERLRMLLCTFVGVLDVDPRAIEEKMGVSPRFLYRLFNNFIEFRVQHLFAILAALEIEPEEFFALAYPGPPGEPTPAAAKLQRRMPVLTPEARAAAIARAGHPTRYRPGSEPPVRRSRFPGSLGLPAPPGKTQPGRMTERSPRPEVSRKTVPAPRSAIAPAPGARAPAAPARGQGAPPKTAPGLATSSAGASVPPPAPEPLEDRLAGAIERVLRQILVEES